MRMFGVIGLVVAATVVASIGLVRGPFDREPPALTVNAPSGATRGVVDLGLTAEDPNGIELVAYVDGAGPRAIDPGWTLDTTALGDGVHTVRIVAKDRAWGRNEASAEVTVHVDNTPPRLTTHVTPAAQGRTTAIFVATDEAATVKASIRQLEPELHPIGDLRWRGLVGFEVTQSPGKVPIVVTATDEAGNVATWEGKLEIEATTFEHGGFIRITPTVDAQRRDTGLIERMFAQRDAAFRADLPSQFWAGPMVRPVPGRKTSTFGKYRSYSDGQKSHHNGVDIAAPTGTAVVASADGVVTFAGPQPIYGNVVIVGHGQGVATSYNHLDSVDVAVGDQVRAGEIVGRVGSTGNSTGPHLHWGLTIDGVHVDAEQWLAESFELSEPVEQALATSGR